MEDLLAESTAWKHKRSRCHQRVAEALRAKNIEGAQHALEQLVKTEREYDTWLARHVNRILNTALSWVEGAVFRPADDSLPL